MLTQYRAPFGAEGERAIGTDLARKLLAYALSKGGDYADLFFEYRISGAYVYEERILKTAGRGVDMGLGVRVQKGEATGYAYVEELTWEAMRRAAETAAAIAAGGASQVASAFESQKRDDSRYAVFASSLDAPGVNKRGLLERADRAARNFDPRITRVDGSFTEETREILVATSEGHWVHDVQPLLRFSIRAVAEDGKKRQTGSSSGGGRIGLEYFLVLGQRPEDHGKEAARVAIAMLEAKDAPAGQFPVVLAPGDSGILLHEAVGHGLEADFNRKQTSNYSGKVGKEVASKLCTVVDDPTLPHGRGSINVDDEGHQATPATLIENGVLAGYMQDRLSARHFSVNSANGRRESFRHSPMPRMTNTILLGGKSDPEEIIRSVKFGVYARKFSGGQVNITNGDFVFSLTESYLIENGKLTAPLKGVNLIGNGPEVLSRVDMLGTDLQISDGMWTCGKEGQSVPVGIGCPTIRISEMTVGGTQVGGGS